MNEITPKTVLDILKEVKFGGESIVSLDMVQEIRIEGDRIKFSLIFQKDNDPNIQKLSNICGQKLDRELKGEYQISIEPKALHRMELPTLPGVKNVIVISSGKGGVGKSTVSSNLAVSLAKTGAKVGLVDADIYGPSIPKMFGIEDKSPEMVVVDDRDLIEPIERYGVKLLSIGLFANVEDGLVWRGPMASNAIKQLIKEGNWGELDYLLIDLPPGTSDIHLTIVQTIAVTGALIVTTPQDVALIDVVKGVSMFKSKSVDVPVLGVVENMSWFTPEELPDNRYYIFGKGGGEKVSKKLNIPLLAQIPIVQSVRECGDAGSPVSTAPFAVAETFDKLAVDLIKRIEIRNKFIPDTKKVRVKKN